MSWTKAKYVISDLLLNFSPKDPENWEKCYTCNGTRTEQVGHDQQTIECRTCKNSQYPGWLKKQ